ncbi:chemotaxis protein MotB [Aliiroseovarius halocynthiae]|uniref:OmpA family protein n=1 Tax=Aliiroseovarius halocynthiae TaxID=985055 RepID=A0A545SPE0_9RHOB|nr:flagellar motor protein MotB [Aliiroseovarius halocynthiae]TQV66853.1 OmpA family protein [Aliiroseovarius halocynthiae]SMR82308.1 chemotaxis protein MotB [Aliiroseovarius halocynthiae]
MRSNERAPVIIKKVKKVSGDGHHGGAWKVAYADFVTAMMAFFLLMWLLNATTEKQRKGIADYFSPTIPITRVSGGGSGSFGGDSVLSEESLSQTGTGGQPRDPANTEGGKQADGAGAEGEKETAKLKEVEVMLQSRSGESMATDQMQRHIVTKVTDEGLLVEVFALDHAPLFHAGTATPTRLMEDILATIAEVFQLAKNGVAIEGHVAAQPVVIAENTAWQLSSNRADRVRSIFESLVDSPKKVQRVTGHADREPAATNVMAVRNNRVELILLRSKR